MMKEQRVSGHVHPWVLFLEPAESLYHGCSWPSNLLCANLLCAASSRAQRAAVLVQRVARGYIHRGHARRRLAERRGEQAGDYVKLLLEEVPFWEIFCGGGGQREKTGTHSRSCTRSTAFGGDPASL